MTKFHIILDYRDFLYSSVNPPDSGINITKLSEYLTQLGADVRVWNYSNIDISEDWSNQLIVYQSTEDRGLFYKDYIEDVILALEKRGAILIPDFFAFRAHHNKAYQELIRSHYLPESKIKSFIFGCFEDLKKESLNINYPCVLKSAAGAKSTGVHLCQNQKELFKKAKQVSITWDWIEAIKDYIKRQIRHHHVPVSQHKNKFIVQSFLPDLKGDYKVLVYGNKAFALERKVADGDFRASGSGILIIDQKIPVSVLECFRTDKTLRSTFRRLNIAYFEVILNC